MSRTDEKSSGKILEALQRRWTQIENLFLSLTTDSSFLHCLQVYRGLNAKMHPWLSLDDTKKLKEQFLEYLNLHLTDILHSDLPVTDTKLKCLEQAFNLAIYYWHGPNDRNFQFRAIVHFLNLETDVLTLNSTDGTKVFVHFVEDGLTFSSDGERRPSRVATVSSVCALQVFDEDLRNLAGLDDTQRKATEKRLLARVRTVQREVMLLVDEWEHRNAILAMEYTDARESLRTQPCPEAQERHAQMFQKMSLVRDALARWCLQSFVDFQVFISKFRSQTKLHPDLHAEFDATDALLLSGLQKIFLPASVSRHLYHEDVAKLLAQWCEARLAFHSTDVSTSLVLSSMNEFLGRPFKPDCWVPFMGRKAYEWTLAFDPCPGLKAMSWGLADSSHVALVAAVICVVSAKLNPAPLDSYWLNSIAGLAQMPDTFPGVPETVPQANAEFSAVANCVARALEILNAISTHDAEDDSALQYLKARLSELGTGQEGNHD